MFKQKVIICFLKNWEGVEGWGEGFAEPDLRTIGLESDSKRA